MGADIYTPPACLPSYQVSLLQAGKPREPRPRPTASVAALAVCTLRHLPTGSWECLARICQFHGKALSPVRAQTLPRRKLTGIAPIPTMGCQPWPGCDEGSAGRLPPLLCGRGLTGGTAPHPSRDTLGVSAQEHRCVPPDRLQSVPLGGYLFQ